MANFVRKGAMGRINAERLYAFNKTLKKDTLRERGYWEVSKDSHPINRWSYRRWKQRKEELSVFEDKLEKVPVDQKFKIKKLLTVANICLGPHYDSALLCLLLPALQVMGHHPHRWRRCCRERRAEPPSSAGLLANQKFVGMRRLESRFAWVFLFFPPWTKGQPLSKDCDAIYVQGIRAPRIRVMVATVSSRGLW
ncbi:hypothetical protein DPX39_100129400 [Trypanosoma brucei equiperdum]|uniref:Uncharacterized protein n=1 Tax=Trypanosoma brucei equiperdum TaxID=630700 RepID=A0A3L6L5J4_9TRYP|nr:hypothetical protein DPX39_100129400 [Trypanosoma brucei equiperdum]